MRCLSPCLLLLPALAAAAEPAKANPADPTVDEVLALKALNLIRTDFRRGEEPVLHAIRTKQIAVPANIWARMENFLPKPGTGQPVAISPALMTAARNLLASGAKPPAEKALFDAKAAITAAGYAVADKGGTAMFGSGGASSAHAFALAMTNIIGEVDQKTFRFDIYSIREAVQTGWREVGIATSANGRDLVIVLGKGTAVRHLGGVAYLDANRNGRYDAGEGKAGVKVSCGDQQMTTGPAGAWWLSGANLDEAKVVFSAEGATASRPVAKDAANVAIDWRLPNATDTKSVDKLIADAEKVAQIPEIEKRRGPLAALLVGSLRAVVDDPRQQKIDQLVAPIKTEFESMRRRILAALGEDAAVATKCVADQKKQWNNTIPAWFKEADALVSLRQQVIAAQAAKPSDQERLAAAAMPAVQKAITAAIDPVFFDLYETWLEALSELAPAAAEKTGKKR